MCPSARIEQLGSHWTDFHEIGQLNIFQKSTEKIQVPLKSEQSNRNFKWRPTYIYGIYRATFLKMKNFSDKHFGENQNTHINLHFFPAENRTVSEMICKNMAETNSP